jgi:nucleotide-binding universal stress UspA family protein
VEAVGVDFAALLEEVRGEAQRSLKALSAGYASLPNVVTKVLIGEAPDQIVRYAKTAGIDLIVLGSHGRHGFKRALLGSVAERVAREADCPVLIVRPTRRVRKQPRHAA